MKSTIVLIDIKTKAITLVKQDLTESELLDYEDDLLRMRETGSHLIINLNINEEVEKQHLNNVQMTFKNDQKYLVLNPKK